jgi:hypothetical protein
MVDFIRFDLSEYRNSFADYDVMTQRAMTNALNVVGRRAVTAIKKWITENYNIKKASISRLVKVFSADRRDQIPTFIARIRREGRGLMKYSAQQTATGVTFVVKKSSKSLRGAFISTWRRDDSQKWVFLRKKKKGFYVTNTGAKRTKRVSVFSLKIADAFTSRAAVDVAVKLLKTDFPIEFQKKLDDQFDKRR